MTTAQLLAAILAAQSSTGAHIATPAVPPPAATVPQPPAEWPFRFNDDDYPAAAMRGNEQGTTRYRIAIDPDGRVARCTITGSSGSAPLDTATCRIVTRRARFAPAHDSAGNAVPDAREGEVTWRMEEE